MSANLLSLMTCLGAFVQAEAMAVGARLEPKVRETASRVATASLEGRGTAAMMSQIVAMKQETQHSRLFRT